MKRPLIIDCDPGLDDAIALAMALRAPQLEVLAVTTSAGNQTPDKTLNNALRLLTLMGRDDIPLAGGAAQPLISPLRIAEEVHGSTGMGHTQLPDAPRHADARGALALMAEVLQASPEPVTLVVTGPMTNAALLLRSYPQLASRLAQIVFMGGGMGAGNATPCAEFNILVDPHAAEIVMQSGVPLVMAGLHMTHQALVLPEEVERIRALANPVACAVAEMLDFYLPIYLNGPNRLPGAAMHDPCTIAWLLAPQLFSSERYWVGVETRGRYTTGMTLVDRDRLTGRDANCEVLLTIDRPAFVELLIATLRRYAV